MTMTLIGASSLFLERAGLQAHDTKVPGFFVLLFLRQSYSVACLAGTYHVAKVGLQLMVIH